METAKSVDPIIIPINDNLLLNRFKSGSVAFQPLKTFLQRDALRFKEGCLAQTYVVVNDNQRKDKRVPTEDIAYEILGYITLTCSEVGLPDYDLGHCASASRYAFLPAVKIARFAVDSRFRSLGLGARLLGRALLIALDEIRPLIGCRFLIADAKKEAIKFYLHQGMELLNTQENLGRDHPLMYIDLFKLVKL